MSLFELLILVSLSIVAMSILFEEGMLLDWFPQLFTTDNPMPMTKPKWYYKPLFACVGCMASIWGVTFYLAYTVGLELREPNWAELLIVCLCCIPLNFIFERLAGGKQ